jgi:transcriptional regulator with XRE-family HTH domain
LVNSLIEKLRVERHVKRMTLRQLASRSGISIKHLCNIENGKSQPSLETLRKIADALGVMLEIHASGKDDPPAHASGE